MTGRSPQAVIDQGRRSKFRGTVEIAERVERLLADFRVRLAVERRVLAERARLANPTVVRPVVRPVRTGNYLCGRGDCPRSFDTAQGVSLHRRRVHEGFDPRNPSRRKA